MSPVHAVKTSLAKTFVWSGRSSRAEYWWFGLFLFLVAMGSELIGVAINSENLYFVVVALCLIPGLSAGARRLHDTDHRAGWLLLVFLPFGVFFLLVMLVSDGTRGANRFGPDLRQAQPEIVLR